MDDALPIGRLHGRSILHLVERGRQPGTKLVEAGPIVGADADRVGQAAAELRPDLPHLGKVELRDDERNRSLRERRVVQSKLLGDSLPLVGRLARSAVDDSHQDPGALHVAQELVTQALSLVSALDESRHVGDHRDPLPSGSSAITPRFGLIVVNG